jgi:hypothetical protein
MARRSTNFLESLVIAAILLALVQTFLEDCAVLAAWPLALRRGLQLAGFGLDLLFTIEFLIRLHLAAADRRLGRYLGPERGWLDFLASVPLLMFSSGPLAASLLLGRTGLPALVGVLYLSAVVKAIRVARILRLLRAARLFGRLRDAAWPMARRHVTVAATIAVSVLALGLVLFNALDGPLGLRSAAAAIEERQRLIARYIEPYRSGAPGLSRVLATVAGTDDSLLVLRINGETRFSRFDDAFYAARFEPGEYGYLRQDGLELFFDLRSEARRLAGQSLIYLGLAALLVLAYLLRYGPHFAVTVTDPLQVMRRGLEEPSFSREVEIPERYQDDEVFLLARSYNEHYLPLKARSQERPARGQPGRQDGKAGHVPPEPSPGPKGG